MAYLILKPTITKGSTILAHEGYVKYLFREQGCSPVAYKIPFLGQIREGIQNVFPAQADKREAFSLPLYYKHPSFSSPSSKVAHLSGFATVLGFFGMLRPHIFTALGPQSFVFVLKDGSQVQHTSRSRPFQQRLASLPQSAKVLDFLIRFKSKTMLDARAYYPNLGSSLPAYNQLCPVRLLKDVSNRRDN